MSDDIDVQDDAPTAEDHNIPELVQSDDGGEKMDPVNTDFGHLSRLSESR